MRYWLAKLAICTLLLYNLLLGTNYATAEPFADIQQLNLFSRETYLQEDFGRFRQLVPDTTKLEGLFTLYRQENSGEIYLAIKPEQLNKNYLATVTLESGVGEGGIYSGLPLADYLFYFQRVNHNLHFVVRNVKFRTADNEPEKRSLARSFSDSVLYSLAIDSIDPYSKNILVNLNSLLLQDFPGLTALLKYSLQADYRLEKNTSYFDRVNSLPENLEIEAIYGFSALEGADLVTLPDSRALNLKVHYSFSQLPENNGYIPRLADDRVGYFITAFQDFSNQQTQEPFVRYINRWHLEPTDPSAPLSPPKQPIVFWIENAVPPSYRQAIREGVLMWNQAFAQAGFVDAIEVKQMPDDADWQPADIRYNTIRWFNSLDAGFAKGLMRVNPLTGEILDADIIIDANMVRSVQQEYRVLIGESTVNSQWSIVNGQQSRVKRLGNRNLLPNSQCMDENSPLTSQRETEVCYSHDASEQAAMGALALSLLHNTKPSSADMTKYVHEYLRYLVAHEVGHTLGLRHNFHGSTMLAPEELNNTEVTHTKGLVASVMDYLPVNIAPQGVEQGDYFPQVIGPYDEWAIAYGYKNSPQIAEKSFLENIALASPQPELSYATDEDIWDINPLANVWDMSSDVLVYSQWQMDNARMMWQRLDDHDLPTGESYSHLRVLFNRVLKYYFRNASLLAQYIGGQSFRRLHAGDEGSWAFVPVPLAKQRLVLTKIQEYVFAEDAFNFSPQLLHQLAPSRWQHWGSPILNHRLDYPIHESILSWQTTILRSLLNSDRLHRLQDIEFKTTPGEAFSTAELFDTIQQGIWTEVFTQEKSQSISSIRRSLQREHLDILLEMVLHNVDAPEDGQTLAWYELRQLQNAIDSQLQKFATELDIYTLAHLEFSGDRITKALNATLFSQ
ncbi:zinc-dependent metalloprotease [Nostoc sp. TCL26-01]|uniref:zinc-dependent metalloprotease n=1 Tax=Nostoc sp. TCL26-01 TaxID=2576904 RepID=UPI0015C0E28E|nr:zinc-dependent metalloprotease [Nostoc sp. TCL26-01]QLE58566.1 DUF5117 domain-containing protein [Nostoc sp. TCL26-01]